MTVLFVTDSSRTDGGVQVYIRTLIEGLKDKMGIVLLCPRGDFYNEIKADGISVYDLPLQRHSFFKIIRMIRQIIQKEKVDIIHANSFFLSVHSKMASIFQKVTVVQTIHGFYDYDEFPYYTNVQKLKVITLRILHRILNKRNNIYLIVLSDIERKFAIEKGLISPQRVVKIYNGVNFNTKGVTENTKLSEVIRRKIKADNNTIVCLTVGRLEIQKGIEYLIKASRIVVKNMPNIRFIIVGQGTLERQLKDLVKHLGLNNYFAFEGVQKNLIPYYLAADIFVLPSLWEGMPLSMLEAMSYSLPIIATRVNGVPEAIEDGVNGILVASKNEAELADAIIELSRSKDKRITYGTNSRILFEEKFTSQKMVDETIGFYKRVINDD